MSASDNKMITAIAKMYPKLKKSQITNFVKKTKKKPVTIASVTKVKVGVIPVKKKKKKKKT